jgi:hypothetical protein
LVPNAKVAPEAREFLNIVGMCQEFHVLPRAGGLLDQDTVFVYLMSAVLQFSEEKRQLDEHKSKVKNKG